MTAAAQAQAPPVESGEAPSEATQEVAPSAPRDPQDLERFAEDAHWFRERALEGLTAEERAAFEGMSRDERRHFLRERIDRLLDEAIRLREEHLSQDLPEETRRRFRDLPRHERWRELRERMRERMDRKVQERLRRAVREGWLTQEDFEELRHAPLDLQVEALMDLRGRHLRGRPWPGGRAERGEGPWGRGGHPDLPAVPPLPPPPPGIHPPPPPGMEPGMRGEGHGPFDFERLRKRHRIRAWRRRFRDRGDDGWRGPRDPGRPGRPGGPPHGQRPGDSHHGGRGRHPWKAGASPRWL